MKKSRLSLVALVFLLAAAGSVPAPASEQACVIVLEGQNRNRTVAGAVNVECGFPYETHTAPFGNWAVSSHYSHLLEDGNQFRGWKPVDDRLTKQHWNSCTTGSEKYRAPNCDLYNAPGPEGSCSTQSSPASVTHGRMYYRTRTWMQSCPAGVTAAAPATYYGCRQQGGSVRQTGNYMTLYELDSRHGGISGDGHDRVATLRFPGASVTLADCDYDGCPEQTSDWVDMQDDASSSAQVEAELRMRARAYLEGFCDWSW